MFKNYFKTAWRNISKRKFYAGINILGLWLGITTGLFLYLFISFHLSFDRYHKNASTTYKIVNEIYFDKTVYVKGASIGMYKALTVQNPNILNTGLMLGGNTFTVSVKNKNGITNRFKENKNAAFVSPAWFSMFDYYFLEGDAKQLVYPNTAIITQSLAQKYFGNSNAINQIINFPHEVPVKVVGVINDKPFNSDLKSSIYISFSSYKNLYPNGQETFFTDWSWLSDNTSLYLTLNSQQSKNTIETELNKLAKDHLGANAKYYHFLLQPLSDVHFNINYGGAIQQSLLYTLMIIGICILIIASVNYVNLSIAQQAKRMVEIGTRKVLGATPWKLFNQFMVETFVTIMIAVIISVFTVAGMFSFANHTLFAQNPIYIVSYTNVITFLICLVIISIALSGIYPAIVLSRIAAHKAFKNITGSWKSGVLKRVLVILQNAIACALIVCTIVIVQQVKFLQRTEIGFKSNLVIMLPLPDTAAVKRSFFSNKLNEIPQVKVHSYCHAAPSSDNNWGGSVKYDNRDWEAWLCLSEVGDIAYAGTFSLSIVAGRSMQKNDAANEFLVNEKMVRELGLKNADEVIGKTLTVGEFNDKPGIIVGVVKDFNSQSLAVPISPLVIANVPAKFSSIAVKLNGSDIQHTIQQIQKGWEQAFPGNVFEYNYVDDQIANLYIKEDLQQKITGISATIAIIISCLGLFGLVSLMTLQRTKEIGIRKVLGATVSSITAMLSIDFFKLVFIAVIIALPLSWWLMNNWLAGFAFHVHISWWVLSSAAAVSVIIALLTISFQAIKAAMSKPAKSLRTE